MISNVGANARIAQNRVVKEKWRLVGEFPTFVVPGRDGRGAVLSCGCEWERVGCVEETVYTVEVLCERSLECRDDDCIVRNAWPETERAYLTKSKTAKVDIPVIPMYTKDYTYGFPTEGGCTCRNIPPSGGTIVRTP